jgi:subtilase family serine protease
VSVTVPGATALGTYYLLACADDTSTVPEAVETNNCVAATSTVQVARPDLLVTAVSEPPATVSRQGVFDVTDTTVNAGAIAAGASTTRYYLSVDPAWSGDDRRLTIAGVGNNGRAVPALGPGEGSTGTVTVTVPGATALGTYYLLACADDAAPKTTEADETNNCTASTDTVVVAP